MTDREQEIIKILQKHVADMDNEFDTLDRKAQQNIAVSSIVATIVGVFKLSDKLPAKIDDPALLAIFAVYGVAFVLSLLVLWPKHFPRTPLDPTRANITAVERKNPDEFYQWLVDSYLLITMKNQSVLTWKGWLVAAGMTCLLLDVGVIVYAAFSH